VQDEPVVNPELLQVMNEDFLAEFEWAMGDEYLFLPADPYGSVTWPSTTNGV
jgi:hypothetical protein